MSVIPFPLPPRRAIHVFPDPEQPHLWQAAYPGCEYTSQFRTEAGARWLVMEKAQEAAVRRGLPICLAEGAA